MSNNCRNSTIANNLNGIKKTQLRNKEFIERNSLFTDIFRNNSGLYNILIILPSVYLIQIAVRDVIETGKINLGFSRLKSEFKYFHYAIMVSLCMFMFTFVLYFNFGFWTKVRNRLKTNVSVWDRFCLLYYVIFQILFLITFGYVIKRIGFSLTLSATLYCEQIRLIMKTHSFVRNKAAFILKSDYKEKDEKQNLLPTKFSKFCYFLFVPTLIYQDNYPRTKNINWSFVFKTFIELVFIMVFSVVLIDEFWPNLHDYGLKYSDTKTLFHNYFQLLLPTILQYSYLHYFSLHAWQNFWGELFCFGDRLLYEDWWNCSKFSQYFRKWNIVIHDWLYLYIYRDLMYILPNSKLPFFCVFIASAAMHEYIITLSINFFFPFLLWFYVTMIFIISLINAFNKHTGNMFFIFSSFVGATFLPFFYNIEYAARCHCNVSFDDNYFSFMLPHFLYCKTI